MPVHPGGSEVAGKELLVLHLCKRFHVSIHRKSVEIILTPDGTTALLKHDMVVLSGSREDVSAVQQVFGKK